MYLILSGESTKEVLKGNINAGGGNRTHMRLPSLDFPSFLSGLLADARGESSASILTFRKFYMVVSIALAFPDSEKVSMVLATTIFNQGKLVLPACLPAGGFHHQ